MHNRMEELSRGLMRKKRPGTSYGSHMSRARSVGRRSVVFAQSFDGGELMSVRARSVGPAFGFAATPWDSFGMTAENGLEARVESFEEAEREPSAEIQPVHEVANGAKVEVPPGAPPLPEEAPARVAPAAPSSAVETPPGNGSETVAQAPVVVDKNVPPVETVDEDSKKFGDDIQALIDQAKGSGSPASDDATPPASTAQSAHPHAIFDKMDMSMANTFSGGSVDLTPKFQAFDESLDAQAQQVREPPSGGVNDVGPTALESFDGAVEPSEMDVVEDLAFITSGAAPELSPPLNSLNLAEPAKSGAETLKQEFPNVVFTSGRRTVSQQANAMAGNVVVNRNWIKQTYAKSAERDALQKWVDDHPEATTKAEIAAGLKGVMQNWTDTQKLRLSRHFAGLAFDVQPMADDAVKERIKTLPELRKFLDSEGGITIWHAEFQKK